MNDIEIPREDVPTGWMLIEGKKLMTWSRLAGIPWAVARKRTPCGDNSRMETVGIIIRISDQKKFEAARVRRTLERKGK